MSDKVSLDFTYRVTYPNGKGYDIRNKGTIAVNELSRSEYIEVAKYTASSGDLNASYLNPVLSGVVTRMKERVIELDMYHSMNGQYLSKAL